MYDILRQILFNLQLVEAHRLHFEIGILRNATQGRGGTLISVITRKVCMKKEKQPMSNL